MNRNSWRHTLIETTTSKPRMTNDMANEMAMRLAKADTSFARAPTVRRWAMEIGCSIGLVVKLPFWLKCRQRLGNSVHPKKPKAVALTDALTATVGQADPELERLINDQKADHEPSPLDMSPRRSRTRRPSV